MMYELKIEGQMNAWNKLLLRELENNANGI